MSSTITGSLQAGVNLTTTFTSGTAGTAKETTNIGSRTVPIGASQAAGQVFTECWSHTYSAVSASFEIDFTALPGVGGRVVDFTTPGVRFFQLINSDPTAGHDIAVGPGVSDGFAALWPGTSAYQTVHGGMPGAGIDDNGQPLGNSVFHSVCKPTALVVDSTHKTVKIDPGASTITSLTVIIAG